MEASVHRALVKSLTVHDAHDRMLCMPVICIIAARPMRGCHTLRKQSRMTTMHIRVPKCPCVSEYNEL